MTLAPAQALGEYILERRLGVGGMAEVWAARDRGPARQEVALKILSGAQARNPAFVAMFIDEAKVGAKLRHRAIVPIESCFQAGDAICQVMPLIDGQTFGAFLTDAHKAGGEMPWTLAIYIAHEIASALEYAHALEDDQGRPLGLVHRDVSPHNVMITRDGRVLLLDFGIAKARERIARTSVGVIKGKIAYMSPRRVHGQEATPSCDVWSLGVVLWEVLAMRPLFAGLDLAEDGPKIVARQIAPIDTIRQGLPPDVQAVLDGLLGDGSIASATTAARSLRGLLRGSGLSQADAPDALAGWATGLRRKRAATAKLVREGATDSVDDEPTIATDVEDTDADVDATATMSGDQIG